MGAAGMTRAFSSCRTSAILASDTSRSYTGCRSSTCSSNAPRTSAAASLLAREAWPRTNLIYRRRRRGMAATGKRRLCTAHTLSGHCESRRWRSRLGSKAWYAAFRTSGWQAPPGNRSSRKQPRIPLPASSASKLSAPPPGSGARFMKPSRQMLGRAMALDHQRKRGDQRG